MGKMFERMRAGFLDLDARPGKLSGSEEWFFPISKLLCVRVFSNGTNEDIQLLMHECGHAWHDVLSFTYQDLIWQCDMPSDFAEFAAISMTYLATPYQATYLRYLKYLISQGLVSHMMNELRQASIFICRLVPSFRFGSRMREYIPI